MAFWSVKLQTSASHPSIGMYQTSKKKAMNYIKYLHKLKCGQTETPINQENFKNICLLDNFS